MNEVDPGDGMFQDPTLESEDQYLESKQKWRMEQEMWRLMG